MVRTFIFTALIAVLACGTPNARAESAGMAAGNAQGAIDSVSGLWMTQDNDGIVEIYSCGGEVCGRFHWLKQDSAEHLSRDFRNPDVALQDRPLCGLQFMSGFTVTADNQFEKGSIYSPRHGAMFSARMKLIDADTLDLHGYMLTPLLGESQIWHRTNSTLACRMPKAIEQVAPVSRVVPQP